MEDQTNTIINKSRNIYIVADTNVADFVCAFTLLVHVASCYIDDVYFATYHCKLEGPDLQPLANMLATEMN